MENIIFKLNVQHRTDFQSETLYLFIDGGYLKRVLLFNLYSR